MVDWSGYLQKSPDLTEGMPERIERDPETRDARLRILDMLPSADDLDGSVLDIGPAGGWEALQLKARYGDRIQCLTLFEAEAAKLRDLDMTWVEVGDVHAMPADWSGRFGLVFMSHVLEHSPAPYVALRECCRVLKPGGWLWVVMPEPYGVLHLGNLERVKRQANLKSHIFCASQETVTVLLRRAGFEFMSYREVAQNAQGHLNYWHRIWEARRVFG